MYNLKQDRHPVHTPCTRFSGMRASSNTCANDFLLNGSRGDLTYVRRQPLFINLRVVMPEAQSQSLCGRGLRNALWSS